MLINTPGIWECHLISLTHFCPWCTNSNWGGTFASSPAKPVRVDSSSASRSSAKSHIVTWSSAPDTAKTDDSTGCQSKEVIGLVCHLKEAADKGGDSTVELGHDLKSQIENSPESDPEASK